MFDITDTWPKERIHSNTFISPHNLQGFEGCFEIVAIGSALNCDSGVIFAASTLDNDLHMAIKEQCARSGAKAFLITFLEPLQEYGFNPFLNLEPAQIAQFYFEAGSFNHAQLTTAFAQVTEAMTPKVVLDILRDNENLFDNAYIFEPILKGLEMIARTTNPFNNTNKEKNIDLATIINEGHALILGGLPEMPHIKEEYRAFINDYMLKPMLRNDLINPLRQKHTYIISSSDAALDVTLTEKLFAHGKQLNINGLWTDYRTAHSSYESMTKIYANSQNKITADTSESSGYNQADYANAFS